MGLVGGASYAGRGMTMGGYRNPGIPSSGAASECAYWNIGTPSNSVDFGELLENIYTPGGKSGG